MHGLGYVVPSDLLLCSSMDSKSICVACKVAEHGLVQCEPSFMSTRPSPASAASICASICANDPLPSNTLHTSLITAGSLLMRFAVRMNLQVILAHHHEAESDVHWIADLSLNYPTIVLNSGDPMDHALYCEHR
jgi:hypothetical protein